MNITQKIVVLFTFITIQTTFGQSKKYLVHTVAFYNFENLFDTVDNDNNDEEWLPNGSQNWTEEKYQQKLVNLGRVLSEIGTNDQQKESPTFIGGCEIENRSVLEDLVKDSQLANSNYGIVHFDSPDKRGIDVALLYKKKHFTVTNTSNIPLLVYRDQEKKLKKEEKEEVTEDVIVEDKSSKRVYTRDQLLVTGFLDGEEVSIIVNHWPSRSGGEKKSSPFREAAGLLNRKIIDSLVAINPKMKIITMGDLNDGSYNKSVKVGIGAKLKKTELQNPGDVYNPFEQMAKEGNASLFYRDAGDIFDQIMFTKPLVDSDYSTFKYWKAGIYNKPYMIQTTGQYKGYPLRHTMTEIGYSDHFPVYIYLIKEVGAKQ